MSNPELLSDPARRQTFVADVGQLDAAAAELLENYVEVVAQGKWYAYESG